MLHQAVVEAMSRFRFAKRTAALVKVDDGVSKRPGERTKAREIQHVSRMEQTDRGKRARDSFSNVRTDYVLKPFVLRNLSAVETQTRAWRRWRAIGMVGRCGRKYVTLLCYHRSVLSSWSNDVPIVVRSHPPPAVTANLRSSLFFISCPLPAASFIGKLFYPQAAEFLNRCDHGGSAL